MGAEIFIRPPNHRGKKEELNRHISILPKFSMTATVKTALYMEAV
jgi:hypothetical protein